MIDLILRFLYIGLFTVGGGLAAIPLMLETVVKSGFVTENLFYSMVAISESTPGPIGINLATYIGFEQYGIIGSLLTSLAIAIPGFLISYAVSRAYTRFSEAQLVKTAFVGVRACVMGMVATAAWGVLRINAFDFDALCRSAGTAGVDWRALAVFAVLWLCYEKVKLHPIALIAIGALLGIVL